jgi:hypothetical protein
MTLEQARNVFEVIARIMSEMTGTTITVVDVRERKEGETWFAKRVESKE